MLERTFQVAESEFAFGTFELSKSKRKLTEAGRPVRLGSRALDVLITLVERAGSVVTKKELMAIVWPYTFVDESNLRVHIAAIRKALGDGQAGTRYIVSVSGSGYCFVAPVTYNAMTLGPPAEEVRAQVLQDETKVELIGREEVVAELTKAVSVSRLTSIVGPGGVGKSSVARAVAQRVAEAGNLRVAFVELALISDPMMFPSAVATTLGVSIVADGQISGLVTFLRDQQVLIILDNCEHIIDPLAPAIETLVEAGPGVRILATSREPLLAEGEWVYRLPCLTTPRDLVGLTAADTLSFPAVQLFIRRAIGQAKVQELDDADVTAIAAICQRLDGNPLAIELVASRVELFGIRGLAEVLDDRLMLVARRRRQADPRQQTLRSALDWSYGLLSKDEQLLLRRLAVFRGPFSVESATEIVADTAISAEQVIGGLISLASKSLVTTDLRGPLVRYRLLHITRAYAQEKLAEAGEVADLQRRHAQHYRSLHDDAEGLWEVMTRAEWLMEFGHTIDDLRAAMDWAFSPIGDTEVGAALTVASLPFGFQLVQIDEFRRRAELALHALSSLDPPNVLAQLRITSALSGLFLNASIDPVMLENTIKQASALSQQLGIARYKIEPLVKQAFFHLELGEYSESVAITEEMFKSAKPQRIVSPCCLQSDSPRRWPTLLAITNGRVDLLIGC